MFDSYIDEQRKGALRLNGDYPPERFRLALDYVTGHNERKLARSGARRVMRSVADAGS